MNGKSPTVRQCKALAQENLKSCFKVQNMCYTALRCCSRNPRSYMLRRRAHPDSSSTRMYISVGCSWSERARGRGDPPRQHSTLVSGVEDEIRCEHRDNGQYRRRKRGCSTTCSQVPRYLEETFLGIRQPFLWYESCSRAICLRCSFQNPAGTVYFVALTSTVTYSRLTPPSFARTFG